MNADGQHAPRSPVVLVVDDEPLIREFLAVALADAGFTVCAAEDGVAALAALRSIRPVAVVTDLMMPHLNGAELIAALRSESAVGARPLPVILITAADPGRARAAGADVVLSKPFDLSQLEELLDRFLRPAS